MHRPLPQNSCWLVKKHLHVSKLLHEIKCSKEGCLHRYINNLNRPIGWRDKYKIEKKVHQAAPVSPTREFSTMTILLCIKFALLLATFSEPILVLVRTTKQKSTATKRLERMLFTKTYSIFLLLDCEVAPPLPPTPLLN